MLLLTPVNGAVSIRLESQAQGLHPSYAVLCVFALNCNEKQLTPVNGAVSISQLSGAGSPSYVNLN